MAPLLPPPWLSSLWICDVATAEEEAIRDRPAWTTAPGPLTIVCRSRLAHQNLEGALAANAGPVELRLAPNRTEMSIEMARFAATAATPYVHVVVGSFDYEGEVASLLEEALNESRPGLVRVECARRTGEAYSFRGRSLCARFGLIAGADPSVAGPPVDTVLFRSDVFEAAAQRFMRTPPDPRWFDLAARNLMARAEAPRLIPLLLGATAEASPMADCSAWESHCLAMADELLADVGSARSAGAGAAAAGRHLLDLVNLLACARTLSPLSRRHLETRAGVLCEAVMADLAGGESWHGDDFIVLQSLLCDTLGMAGPDTLEMRLEEGATFFRQRLADFAVLAPGEAVAAVVRALDAARSRVLPDNPAGDRLGELMRRLEEADRERRNFRAQAANTSDQLLAERHKLRKARARIEELRQTVRSFQEKNDG